jgi:hypothetical protein
LTRIPPISEGAQPSTSQSQWSLSWSPEGSPADRKQLAVSAKSRGAKGVVHEWLVNYK